MAMSSLDARRAIWNLFLGDYRGAYEEITCDQLVRVAEKYRRWLPRYHRFMGGRS